MRTFITAWIGIVGLSLSLLIPKSSFAQFFDDFSDDDLSDDISWMGNLGDFVVANAQLQLDAGVAGASTLSTAYVWQDSLRIGLDVSLQFAPSADNHLKIYLYHKELDPSIGEAVYLDLGESGSNDAFVLYTRDIGGMETEIRRFSQIPHSSSLLEVGVEVTYWDSDRWEFSFDFQLDGSSDETTSINFAAPAAGDGYFGIECQYTSTRVDKFDFDNAKVEKIVPDKTPPVLARVDVVSASKLILLYDEVIQGVGLDPSQFVITPGNVLPSSLIWDAATPTQVCLTFSPPLVNQTSYQITVTNIEDVAGNIASVDDYTFTVFTPEEIEFGDIIINEIHPQPSTNTAVAAAEFIELFNRSNKILNIEELNFSDASSTINLPDYILFPGEYIVITEDDDLPLFLFADTVVGVSSFPSLNNSGDDLTISANGVIIDAVNYNSSWYGIISDPSGISLETKNPESRCRGMINWSASTDAAGGSPGEVNSVFIDQEPEGLASIQQVEVASTNQVTLEFNIEMNDAQLSDVTNFDIQTALAISSVVSRTSNGSHLLQLIFIDEMVAGTTYTITFNTSICACNGLKWPSPLSQSFGLGEQIEEGDIRISEILYDPFSGQAEFIELVNTSQKIINAEALWLTVLKLNGSSTRRQIKSNFQLFPSEYHVLTGEPTSVINNYTVPFPSRAHSESLPSLSNDGGELTLFIFDMNGDSIFIDGAIYSEDFHDPLLDEQSGVSLERLHIDGNGFDPSNWYSAATSKGGATPTGENSQMIDPAQAQIANFELLRPTFSPDGDGFEDVMVLQYELGDPGFIAQINIFAHDGTPIKKLVRNESLGTAGQFLWAGDTDDGELARVGIYYVVISAFRSTGETLDEKKKIVLARQL